MRPFEWARLVARDPTLPSRARHVAAWLALHAQAGPPACSKASLRELQKWTGMGSRDTVVFALRDLADAGWLAEHRQLIPSAKGGRRYLTTVHYLVTPEATVTPAAPVDNHPVDTVDGTHDTNGGVVRSPDQGGPLTGPKVVRSGDHKKVEGSSKEHAAGRVAHPNPVDNPTGQAQIHDLVTRIANTKRLR